MIWYKWFAIIASIICLISLLIHFIRLIRLGNPKDLAKSNGNIPQAVKYSFTGAMSPKKKESAYLNLPTYLAGMIYHMGTFLSIFVFILLLIDIVFPDWMKLAVAAITCITALSGFGILIKRIVKKELRFLSNPDDFISNLLVSLFQFATAAVMISYDYLMAYFVIAALFLLYIPIGKLKHTIYFFAARYHLGYFYGRRGVWPPKKLNDI